MNLGAPSVAKPVFDASLTFLAINTLEDELEEADCFENIQYSEILEDFTVRRRVLRHKNLREDWFKVLRSGEVLVTLFHMSDKVRSVLDKHNCPLQPVLEGNEHSSWQRLRTQFLCNWQSLYSVIEYLQQYRNVKVDGLDSTGKIIVDCADIETARIITMGALTQCFIILGKQPLASINGDCQRPAIGPSYQHQQQEQQKQQQQQQQQQHNSQQQKQQRNQVLVEDTNNNAGNTSKVVALQPKVGRLGNKKRVICIYDTTTSEGSDKASIDATPIDNRNATDAASGQQLQRTLQPAQKQQQRPQQQQQKRQRDQQERQQQLQEKQEQQQQPSRQQPQQQQPSGCNEYTAVADDTENCLLTRVLLRLDEVKSLLMNSSTNCNACRQRAAGCLEDTGRQEPEPAGPADAAGVQDTSAAAGYLSAPGSPPHAVQLQNAHSSAAVTTDSPALLPTAANAPAGDPLLSSKPPTSGRRRVVRKVVSKRVAVTAAKLMVNKQPTTSAAGAAATAVAAAATTTADNAGAPVNPRRSRTMDSSAKSVTIDADDTHNSPTRQPVQAAAPTVKKAAKLGRTKIVVRRRAGATKFAKQLEAPGQQPAEQPSNRNAEQKATISGRKRAGSGDHLKKAAAVVASGTDGKLQQQQRSSTPDSTRSRSSGRHQQKGANGNNDGGGVKRITKSTVQDLINQLQAVINEDS